MTPVVFVLAAFYVAVAALLSAFWNAMGGLAIILLGVPAYLYWRRKSKAAGAEGLTSNI